MTFFAGLAKSKQANFRMISTLARHRELLWKLSEREIVGRYRGSVLGILWSLITPLLMLAVYTFVFTTVFKARWAGVEQASSADFALNLFAGLIVFNIFAECATRAPTLILSNSNLVTKVVFPLEILNASTVASAIFHAITSTVVLIFFEAIAKATIPPTMVWLPLVWLPLILGCLGMSWIISALGVFLRDLSQVMNVCVSMMMFLSTVFYPLSALPPNWQPILRLNPLVIVIEQSRRVMIEGTIPSLSYLIIGCMSMFCASEISLRFFLRAKRGFADVI